MGLSIPVYVVIGALAWGVGYLLNSPIPKGYEDPWTLRCTFALFRLNNYVNYFKSFYMSETELVVGFRSFIKPWSSKFIGALPVKVEVEHFDGVKVRVYRPASLKPAMNPAVVYYHGGGWVIGNVAMCDDFCRQFSHETDSVVISVEYRLAPEHIYPAGLDDCVKATVHFLKHADKYYVDPSRVAVSGGSAGGNLAAATALRLRDMKFETQPKLQVLIYPCLQAVDFRSPSYQASATAAILPDTTMVKFWNIYATGDTKHVRQLLKNKHTPLQVKQDLYLHQLNYEHLGKDKRDINYVPYQFTQGDEQIWKELKDVFMDPYFAPLMAKDLKGLPEAVILTAELDVLKNDGIWYGKYLQKFGVPVTSKHFESGYHGFVNVPLHKQKDTVAGRRFIYSQVKSKL